MKQIVEESIKSFSECIDRLEAWIISGDSSEYRSALHCSSVLSELNFRALSLPGPNPKNLQDRDLPQLSPAEIETARTACTRLPLQYYLKIFNPSDPADTEPVKGDLVDDILDIFRDVVPPKRLYKEGVVDDVLWHWNFKYKSHCGWHVNSAINTLNAYLMYQAKQYGEL